MMQMQELMRKESVPMERKRFFYLSLSNTVGGAIFDRNGLVQGEHFDAGKSGI